MSRFFTLLLLPTVSLPCFKFTPQLAILCSIPAMAAWCSLLCCLKHFKAPKAGSNNGLPSAAVYSLPFLRCCFFAAVWTCYQMLVPGICR